jgi:tRNA A-37 threonylcarbamoyl transferase component Bud32
MQTCQYCHTENRDDATYCNHCGGALTAGAPPAGGASGAAGVFAASPPRPNSHATGRLPLQSQLRGRYLILQLVGQGGMAAVYRATNRRTKATVAIKEMSQDGLTPTELRESLESFQFEAETLQRLHHPNLPRVYESFSENSRHYLVMDYIDGTTLEQHQQSTGNGPLSESEVLRWAGQIASVLGYLHSQRPPIIFRDLKPSNIMLTSAGEIKLIDFGIARVFAPGRSRDTQVLGTPGFAPPEQYGKAQTDARADVYSFGCTLYQLLSGYDPGSTPFYLPPLDTRNPKVSPSVQAAILRATKLDRDQRYQSVDDFARDLRIGQQSGTTTTAASNGWRGTGAGVGAAARVAQPTMAAVVVVQPQTIDFGALVAGQRGTRSFTVGGQGNVPVRGKIKVLSPWLSLDRDQFDGPSTLVQLVAETSKIPKPGKQVSTLQIDCDRQHLYVPVTLSVLPAPVPVTRVVPAVGARKVAGQSANRGRGGAQVRPAPAPARAPGSTGQSKYRSPMVGTPRRNWLLRLFMSLVVALGSLGGAMALVHWLAATERLSVPTPLPVILGILIGSILLASGAAIAGSGGPGWHGRFLTTLMTATLAGVLLILGYGPFTWTGIDTIMRATVTVPTILLLWTPLALSAGAALGAEPTFSHWMLATIGFIGRFPRGFIGLAGAIACGIACHNLATPSVGSYAISCVTIVGALIGGILAYRIAGAMRSLARVRP